MKLARLKALIVSVFIYSCASSDGQTPQATQTQTPAPEETSAVVSSPAETNEAPVVAKELPPGVKAFCQKLDAKFKEYRWGETKCEDFNWHHVRNSDLGTPLVWTYFGEEKDATANTNTTIILCGVHGDEITPVKFCWDLMNEMKNHQFHDKQVIIAPLVAPDSFFKDRPTRTNGRGVDVNRNFPTKDWKDHALVKWKNNLKGDRRKYPGPHAASEQETFFQMNLIKRYNPNKVISVHSPLTILDYDGPGLKAQKGQSALQLLEEMSRRSSGYKISNYPVFPGSLGNWSGKERHIPTYTLELPNTNPAKTTDFWNLFKDAVIYAIENKMGPPVD